MDNTERYNQIVDETFDRVRELSRLKGGEYVMAGDRLDNFRRNAKEASVTMETCWKIYAGKHWDAISTYIRDMQNGRSRPRSEPISGRVDDMIVYLLLFKLMLEDRGMEPAAPAQSGDADAAADAATAFADLGRKLYADPVVPGSDKTVIGVFTTDAADGVDPTASGSDDEAGLPEEDTIRSCGCPTCVGAVAIHNMTGVPVADVYAVLRSIEKAVTL